MSVRVEFLGIPRERAGVGSVTVEAKTLGDAIEQLRQMLPEFAADCLQDGELRRGYLASINGIMFTTEARMPLRSGDTLMILSADVGG
ncbi:hypothetical protein Mal4_07890 [Maioricimonas rarisocia]|uniref:ThiS family protein n=1 Tax=Maioricimonas rarisocia TaxID=2528026 RepID=A0A517Z1Z6_9PLAN|nr:MoaD/ThiS family protein [Maioricimonas rarisocia]QDU36503.1 hypothetical protein Mal4_07890 [Maioricimonas rarisocia]